MSAQYKAVACEIKALDAQQGIYEVMASTEAQDRQGDVLVSTGAQLDNYRRNPVVLWAHDYTKLPVARTLDIEPIPGVGLRAKMQFAPQGVDPFIDAVRSLWENGFLNAASVGFQPRAGTPNGNGGTRYTGWELLEFSIVPIPANPDALRLAYAPEVQKRGRVLSAKNEAALRDAIDTLVSILSQLDGADVQAAQDESVNKASEPNNEVDNDAEAAMHSLLAALKEL